MTDYLATTYPDASKPQRPVDEKGARLRTTPVGITTTVAVLAANDRIFLGRVPSNARMVDCGKFSYSAFGGSAAMSLGFYNSKMSSAEATTAAAKLFSAQAVAAAGSRQVMAGVALADLGKRVWQLAGLSSDPGGEMDVVATVTTATAATGTIFAELTFTRD